MKSLYTTIFFALLACTGINAQGSLLEEIDDNSAAETYHMPAFKALRLLNLQTTKTASEKELVFYVSHRFGSMSAGISTLWGLDYANTNFQWVYGISDKLNVSFSRESVRRTYALSTKMTLLKQGEDADFNLAAFFTSNINTQLSVEQFPGLLPADRLSYATQAILSKRFNDKLSLLVSPTFVRQNLVWEMEQEHNQYSLGLGGRYMLNRRVSLCIDYAMHMNRYENSVFEDPLAIGVNIETGGHVFQLMISNSQSSNAPTFLSNAEGNWESGDVFLGFNISRSY